MMTGAHPDELELFSHVEGDLPDERQAAVAAHVAACRECTEHVRRLEAARDALRAAPLLQLPKSRREAILAGLPRREPRVPFMTPKRLLAVMTPVAAVVAVVAVLASTRGERGADERAAAPRAETAAQGGDQPAAALEAAAAPLRTVAGPPAEVARFLRESGFDARVVAGAVEVRNADPNAVELALLDRPAGDVPVYVR